MMRCPVSRKTAQDRLLILHDCVSETSPGAISASAQPATAATPQRFRHSGGEVFGGGNSFGAAGFRCVSIKAKIKQVIHFGGEAGARDVSPLNDFAWVYGRIKAWHRRYLDAVRSRPVPHSLRCLHIRLMACTRWHGWRRFSPIDHRVDYLLGGQPQELLAMNNVLRGLGVSAVAAAFAVFVFDAQAQAPKKAPACNSLKDEGACKTRDDCTWVSALVDAKTQKEKRKGYCRAMPKAPAKK
jgi:hypothetical protein